MGRTFQKETTKLLQAKRRRRRWKRAIVPFALTVVLATSSMLTYPAITLESSTICGMGDHTHTQECYQRQLICGRQECEAVAEKTETVLNCSLSVHEHTAECVDADGQNVCGQDAHTHGDGCYQTIYTPGVEGHKHTDACYQDVLICQKPQHTHSDACYPKQETSAAPEEPVNTETSVTPEKPASTGTLAESGEPANIGTSAESGEAVSAETSAESGEPASTGTSAESGEPANTEASAELGESANTEAPTESANPETSVKPEESAKSDVPKDSETTETSEEEDSEIVWEAQTFTANGKDYTITVEVPASAKIPKGAVLTVKELQENTTPGEYQNYSQQAVAKVQQKLEKDVLYARYFKLAIEADGIEIQPAEKVTVKVTYRNSVENPSDAAVKAVFFGDTTEILDVKTNASGQNWNEAKVEVGKMTVLAIAGVGTEEAKVEAEETENVEAEAEAVEENKAEAAEEVEGIENLEQEVAVEDADPEEEAEPVEVNEEAAENGDSEENGQQTETDADVVEDENSDDITEAEEETEIVDEDSEEAVEDEEETETEETEPEVYILTATGEDYRIEASYTAEAELPEGTVLVASEIEQGTEAYESYCQQALTAVQENERTVLSFARFFDLTFFAETEEIEAKAPVTVKITYTGEEEVAFVQLENGMAVMVLQNEENEKEAIIETESLGAYGIVAVEEIPEPILSFPTETKVFTTEVSGYSISVEVPENSFYETVYLKAEVRNWEELDTEVQNKLEAEGIDKNSSQSLDIRFENENGEEVEPVNKVSVTIKISDENVLRNATEEESKLDVYHVVESEDAETTVEQVASSTDGSVAVHSESSAVAAFDTDSFSIYTVTLTGKVITASGETYRIEVSYDENAGIPANAELAVSEIGTNSSEYQNYLNKAKQAIYESDAYELPYARFFDISILVNGEEIEPLTPVTVRIYFEDNVTSTANVTFETVHFTGNTVDTIETEVNTEKQDKPIEFTAESFSVYGVAYQYTVDYYYGDMEYHMVGGSQMMLSELFTKLEIEEDTANIVEITFTDESLVTFIQSDEDYLISSLEPFDTEEWLTITMEDGTVYEIQVLDDKNGNPGGSSGSTSSGGDEDPRYYKNTIPVYWDQADELSTNATGYTSEASCNISSVSLNSKNVKWGNANNTSWSDGTTLASYFPGAEASSTSTDTSTMTSSSLSITAKNGYYVTGVVVACAPTGGGSLNPFKCSTWRSGNAFDRDFDLSKSTYNSNGLYQLTFDISSLEFSHNGGSAPNAYFILITTAAVPSPLYVEYDYGDIVTNIGSGTHTAFDTAAGWTKSAVGNIYIGATDGSGNDGGVQTDATQYKYTYASEHSSDVTNWKHYANRITDEAIEQAAAAGYYFAGWSATFYNVCNVTSNASGAYNNFTYDFSNVYGTATYTEGAQVGLVTHVQLVAQWKPIELKVRKIVEGLPDGYEDSNSYSIQPQREKTTSTFVEYGDVKSISVAGNGSDSVTLSGVPLGTYRVTEVNPTSISYNGKAYTCTTTYSSAVVITTENMKTVQELIVTNTYSNYPSFSFTKTFEGIDTNLPSATFALYTSKDCSGDASYTATSDSTGKVMFTNIAPGTYYMKETSAPDGYVLSETVYTVIVDQDGTTTINGTVSTDTTIKNKLNKADIIIKKVDNKSGNALSGATFMLRLQDSTAGGVIPSGCEGLDENGCFTVRADGTAKIKGLTNGTYILTETKAPDGYIILTTGITITVTSGKIVVDNSNSDIASVSEDGITLTVKNTAGVALPNTGGSGTLPYTLSGLLLMAIAMMYGLVLRRRKA